MYRYFIHLAYSGTNYHGWQIQENTPDTVQQVVNNSLSTVLNEKVEVMGAGRTDTGVHAKEFYAHFDSEKGNIHTDQAAYLFKLNTVLPRDIAAYRIIPVAGEAHARFDAVARSYEYVISRRKDPFLINKAYYLYGKLDVQAMNIAAKELLNYKDFSSFSKSNTQVATNECDLMEAYWEEQPESLLVFKVTANRFLRNMVRAMVGTLLEVGKGKIRVDDVNAIMESKNRSDAGMSVPAGGLYLTRIQYKTGVLDK